MNVTLDTYKEIASFIPGCQLMDNNRFENTDRGARLIMECGAKFDICHNIHGQFHISGCWPMWRNQQVGPWNLYPRQAAPTIHISTEKKPEVIARELQRRFLTPFLALWRLCMAWIGSQIEYTEIVNLNAAAIADALDSHAGPRCKPGQQNELKPVVLIPSTFNFSGEFEACKDSVSLHLRSLTPAQATKLAKFLTTLA